MYFLYFITALYERKRQAKICWQRSAAKLIKNAHISAINQWRMRRPRGRRIPREGKIKRQQQATSHTHWHWYQEWERERESVCETWAEHMCLCRVCLRATNNPLLAFVLAAVVPAAVAVAVALSATSNRSNRTQKEIACLTSSFGNNNNSNNN